ncbi:MAG: glycoside hydrolase family 125 protein [Betaproteobacteria bacterium]
MLLDRRTCLAAAAAGALTLATARVGATDAAPTLRRADFTSRRPPPGERRFSSVAVEAAIAAAPRRIADPELAWLFENCLPNTLDTTVTTGTVDGRPDTFVITGDIDAMWLRDSTAQVWPYLPFAREDAALARLLQGVIHRQARCILIDPYANAFLADPAARTRLKWAIDDRTDMRPGVSERKWEVDSLCYPIRLAHGYWRATGDTTPFDAEWAQAMRAIVRTFKEQQRKDGPGPYRFQRRAEAATETLVLEGLGHPARPVGLIHSMFRPSDDACVFPLFIPANLFAVVSLRQLAALAAAVRHDAAFATECAALADEIERALRQYGRMATPQGSVWAYEVDGYGNQLFMDDANAPGLLSLPYLGACAAADPLYRRTRARAWSRDNPYFFQGRAGEGIGGPHEGLRMIWPMSILVRAITSTSATEIRQCLQWLKATHAGSGFMHEAFDQDDPAHFTRAWFAWANSLFGELVLALLQQRPALLATLESHPA